MKTNFKKIPAKNFSKAFSSDQFIMRYFVQKSFASLASFVAMATISGCALPDAGPTAENLLQTSNVTIVQATPSLVAQLAVSAAAQRNILLSNAIERITSNEKKLYDHRLSAGDTVNVRLWVFAQGAGQESEISASPGPTANDIGKATIAGDGTIDLPYVHRVHVVGLTVPQAQEILTRAYIHLGTMQNPAVSLTTGPELDASADSDGVIVTGATGKPSIFPWNVGGITMARALTLAMGDGTSVMGSQNNTSNDHSDASVTVSRGNREIARLPLLEALEQDIALQPSDHLIVRHDASVRISLLGGGLTHNTLLGFSEAPTLAQVIAAGGGLNANTANDHEIFVLRRKYKSENPILYVFPMNSGSGIEASQQFPTEDQDIVYVSEAPIVPVERVIVSLLQIGLIAAAVH